MDVQPLALEGLLLLKPRVFPDERGYFFESYNQAAEEAIGPGIRFVQDNQSWSAAGVVRGLHFQNPPYAQGKLVRVAVGRALDVVVDLRRSSPTYGQHLSIALDAVSHHMLWVPEGFAHGFAALEPTLLLYKCTNSYHKASESGVRWNDPALDIDWQVSAPLVSDKDQALLPLAECANGF
jgi:dTDP-4-dehydrorhamnose 3,5-epimerase